MNTLLILLALGAAVGWVGSLLSRSRILEHVARFKCEMTSFRASASASC